MGGWDMNVTGLGSCLMADFGMSFVDLQVLLPEIWVVGQSVDLTFIMWDLSPSMQGIQLNYKFWALSSNGISIGKMYLFLEQLMISKKRW
jgi:hypothetical protein